MQVVFYMFELNVCIHYPSLNVLHRLSVVVPYISNIVMSKLFTAHLINAADICV